MVQKVSVQKGVTFYIAERGRCVDIDIDDDVTALTFGMFLSAIYSMECFHRRIFCEI